MPDRGVSKGAKASRRNKEIGPLSRLNGRSYTRGLRQSKLPALP
jgi:hypothetical protein